MNNFIILFILLAVTYSQTIFHPIKVQLATVLDGYNISFDGLLCNTGSQFFIWHERSSQKSLKLLFPDHPYLQMGLNGAVIGLSLQNYVSEIIIQEDTRKHIILTLKPEVQKGTTLKLSFKNIDNDGEQDKLIDLLESSFEQYVILDDNKFDYAALKLEHKYIQYVQAKHDEL